jgi:kynurenine formamidase
MPRFVDLSIYLENEVLSDPPPLAPKITYQKHTATVREFMAMLPGTTEADYPDGEAAAVEWVTLNTHTHNGTHLDAPYHFHSTQDAKLGDKKPSITIDQVPLDWCFRPGVKLDFRHFADGYVCTAADVEAELKRIGHELKPFDIVVVNNRAGSRYGHKGFLSAGRDIGYCHLEKMHNLEALPGDGFTISCFPHKIRGASAGWTRAVAIFED